MPNEAQILEPTEANFSVCAKLLSEGEVVALPTETVYGLATHGLNESALRKIFEVKGRPLIDPLILHFRNLEQAVPHVEASSLMESLTTAFWPGPLTLIVGKRSSIPDIATAGKPSVAIRVPAHPIFQSVLNLLDFPLAAPSANPFGYVSPTLAEHVQRTLGKRIPAILDGGPTQFGLESTILDIRNNRKPTILRHGPIAKEVIETALGRQVLDHTAVSKSQTSAQTAPGMLSQHYSPNTTLSLLEFGAWKTPSRSKKSEGKVAIVFTRKPMYSNHSDCYWLSDSGSLEDIAHNLFSVIQKLDQLDYVRIRIELSPAQGIGLAINDRLRRAAANPSSTVVQSARPIFSILGS